MNGKTANKPNRVPVILSYEAEARIRVAAAKRTAAAQSGRVTLGDIINELAITHLAPVDEAQAAS